MQRRRIKRAVLAKRDARKMFTVATTTKPNHNFIDGERELRDRQVETFCSAVAGLRRDDKFTDFTLTCEGVDYPVHRVILAAGSSYFQAMFCSGMNESSLNKAEIKDVEQRAMDIILNFLYLGVTNKIEDVGLLKSVISASNMLQVQNLYDFCCDEHLKHLSVNKFHDIWATAQLYDNTKMMDFILNFLCDHVQDVIKTPEFLLLSSQQLETLLHKSKAVNHELLVKGIMVWFGENGHKQEDERFLLKVFEIVDLTALSDDCISSILNSEEVQSSMKLLNMVSLVASHRLSTLTKVDVENVQLFFFAKVDNGSCVQSYSYKERKWSSVIRSAFVIREGAAAVHLNKYIYFIGGKDPVEKNESVEVCKYDMKITSSLETVAPMTIARSNAEAVAIGRKIYVYGGTEKAGGPFLNSHRCLEIYDSHSDCWSIGKESTYLFKNPSMVVLNGLLYLAEYNHLFMEVYSVTQNEWTTQTGSGFTSLVFSENKLWLASHNEKLFIFMLRGNQLNYRSFDPVASKWNENQVVEFESPNIIRSVWGVYNRHQNIPFVCLLDNDKRLHEFDPESKLWLRLSVQGALVAGANYICVMVL